MPIEVILPKVDMDMETGKISAWHVSEGDHVAQGDALFDIETDKAAMEVESPATGHLHHIIAKVGAEVPIGRTVAWIYDKDEQIPEAPPKTVAAVPAPQKPTEPARELAEHDISNPVQSGLRATPAARKRAQETGVHLRDITGSGPRGRVQKSDVEAYVDAPQTAPAVAWDTEATPLNIVRSGTDDGTPWLLIHGLAGDANAWEFIEKPLAASAPVIRLELPCHGKSPKLHIESFAHLIAIIRATFDELNLASVRLIGHSLGGAVALALADTRPNQIETLTLLSPAGLGPEINGGILDGVARASSATSLGPWLRMMMGAPDSLSNNYIQAAMLTRKDPEVRRAQRALQNVLFPDDTQGFDLIPALNRINCPTRIIFGKKDQVIPWRHALKAPGHVSLNLFPEMGHLPAFEDPDAVLALL